MGRSRLGLARILTEDCGPTYIVSIWLIYHMYQRCPGRQECKAAVTARKWESEDDATEVSEARIRDIRSRRMIRRRSVKKIHFCSYLSRMVDLIVI